MRAGLALLRVRRPELYDTGTPMVRGAAIPRSFHFGKHLGSVEQPVENANRIAVADPEEVKAAIAELSSRAPSQPMADP